MSSQWRALLGGALLGGALVGALLRLSAGPPPGVIEGPSVAPAPAFELRAELDRERARVRELTRRLSEVEPEFSAWRVLDPADPERAAVQPDSESEAGQDPREGSDAPWFDSESLLQLGIRASEVERIREVWEQYLMRKLKIQNQRLRHGEEWTERGKWMRLNEATARQELGDESYEAMRYAAGERNRVIFSELLESSPAAEAGLMPEDELISYADQRVFSPSEMKRLAAQGAPGEWVEIRILRHGELQRFFVKRGPIGVRMQFGVRPPYELP